MKTHVGVLSKHKENTREREEVTIKNWKRRGEEKRIVCRRGGRVAILEKGRKRKLGCTRGRGREAHNHY